MQPVDVDERDGSVRPPRNTDTSDATIGNASPASSDFDSDDDLRKDLSLPRTVTPGRRPRLRQQHVDHPGSKKSTKQKASPPQLPARNKEAASHAAPSRGRSEGCDAHDEDRPPSGARDTWAPHVPKPPPSHLHKGTCPKSRFVRPRQGRGRPSNGGGGADRRGGDGPGGVKSYPPHRGVVGHDASPPARTASSSSPPPQRQQEAESPGAGASPNTPSSIMSRSMLSPSSIDSDSGDFDLDQYMSNKLGNLRAAHEPQPQSAVPSKQATHTHSPSSSSVGSLPSLSSTGTGSSPVDRHRDRGRASSTERASAAGADVNPDTRWGNPSAKMAIGGTSYDHRLPELECRSCNFAVLRFSGCAWTDDVTYMHFRNFNGHSLHLDRLREKLIVRPGFAAYACQCAWQSVEAFKPLEWVTKPGTHGGAANEVMSWQRKRAAHGLGS